MSNQPKEKINNNDPRRPRIVPAQTVCVESLDPQITQILNALGFARDEAWVSDESMIGDFPYDEEEQAAMRKLVGREVQGDEYLYKVALELRNKPLR